MGLDTFLGKQKIKKEADTKRMMRDWGGSGVGERPASAGAAGREAPHRAAAQRH